MSAGTVGNRGGSRSLESTSASPSRRADILRRDGFLVIRDALRPADVAELRGLLLPLFARFATLPAHVAVDLGSTPGALGPPDIPEINRAVRFAPQLRRSAAFAACRMLARELLGSRTWYTFDHAIAKPPHNRGATDWHQDQAYRGNGIPMGTVHFWIPLQDVALEGGCMEFIPGSHRGGLRMHRRRGGDPHTGALVAAGVCSETAVACPVAAGSVLAHLPLTLHYTEPNRTAVHRYAWIVHFGPRGRIGLLPSSGIAARLFGSLGGSWFAPSPWHRRASG